MTFSIIALSSKYPVADTLEKIAAWFVGRDEVLCIRKGLMQTFSGTEYRHIVLTDTDEQAIEKSDIVISVGGDGTLLRTARLVIGKNKPILGVNSGRLGFLANIPFHRIEEALAYTAQRNFVTDSRIVLEAITGDGQMHYALNEFLFSKGNSGSMVRLTAYYDGLLVNRYWADGVIVAGPTGSTAYNMSCGGPILAPSTEAFVVTPINPHTLTTRPLVLSAGKPLVLRAEPKNQDVIFSKDGENCDISGAGTEATISRSDYTIELIKLPDQTFFDTLRNKLMWGMDIRDNFTDQ